MKQKSIKNIFSLYISIIIISCCILGVSIYGFLNYRNELKNFKKYINNSLESIYPVLADYLWRLDYENLRINLNILYTSNKNLCSIRVFNEFNEVIFEKKRKCNKSKLLKFERKIYLHNKYLGKINISFSKSFFENEIKNLIFFNVIISLIIALIIIYFVSKFFIQLNKHLFNIINTLEIITSGNYNVNFKFTNFKELDEIIKNLNLMIQEIRIKDRKNEELNQRLNLLINSIPVGIFIFNEKGEYIEINDTACEMLKMKKEEILSKKIPELSTKEFTLEDCCNVLNRIIEEGEYDFEWKLKTKDGKIIDIFGKGKKVLIGKEYWIIIVLSDVTYLKKLEKEVIKKEKLESIGILAGGIAHDFNNILTTLAGAIELIQIYLEKEDFVKAKDKLQNLNKSINRAKSLTHQLLTFSKGGAPVKRKFENLANLIKDTVEFVLSGSAIEVSYSFDKNLKPVEIDPDQISLAIENIILNAKEAMKNKGKIDIKAVNSLDFVKISIKDYGPGIPKEIREKIWDPYFTTKKKGTGLGLAIVYSIIKKHNGDIKVYSEEGKFTDFQLFLPIAKDVEENGKETDSLKLEFDNIKLKILIMEDEEDIQELLFDLCRILGHTPTIVKNGEEAIEVFKKEKFDIVILDLTIKGGMGGEECIKELKKIDPNIKAIVYSGYSESPIMKEYKKYGFNAVLKKPFTLNELKEAIKNCLYS